ncbi:endothelin-converting enzyme 2 [Bombyx mori]|uniref:Uncharacterized protein n=1 Tax=Bombyx mori TaxID=7091 RepID=A0A8R2G984_BOMMO|nr:endothelin-converting enzyme 2 [Bombyx mori]
MDAWSAGNERGQADAMGPTVTRTASAKTKTPSPPPLKNGKDIRESGYLIAVGSRTARFRRKHKKSMTLIVILTLMAFLLIFAIVMTVLYVRQKHKKPVRLCETKECLRSAASLALSMDRTADPCEDFNQYVCGNWGEEHPMPEEYSSYDWFSYKQDRVLASIKLFLTKNSSKDPLPIKQARDMYAACMDVGKIDQLGHQPVYSILASIGLPSHPTYLNISEVDYSTYTFDWVGVVTNIKVLLGMDILIGFDIFSDPLNSSAYRLALGSPETTNPFPSLYAMQRKWARKEFPLRQLPKQKEHSDLMYLTHDEETYAKVHKLYYAELLKIFLEGEGGNQTASFDNDVIVEKVIAAAATYYDMRNDLYDIESENDTESEIENYVIPRYTADELQALTDQTVAQNNGSVVPIWKKYVEGVFNVSETKLDFGKEKILVADLDLKYMSRMAAYVAKIHPVVLELYVWVKVVEVIAIHTTSELRSLYYDAYNDLQESDTKIPTRAHLCTEAVNDMMGMAVAYGIADPDFVNNSKPKIERMIYELKNSLAHLVGQVKWMDDNTKVATYQKIILMKSLIGFPDWLMVEGKLEEYYKGIEINRETHLYNMINIIQVKIKNVLNKFRENGSLSWATDPTEVNAYHTFQDNTITVPLVILQYPFFDLGLDSLNYGSLGTVLGHEITHGFDSIGRRYDKFGNMVPWWTNNTIDTFVNMSRCFVDQYSAYYLPEINEHVSGKNTLPENIADNGGVREAIAALKEHLKKFGPELKLPGFEEMSPEQLFFLSYGNLWCGTSTKSSLKVNLKDEHTPLPFRAKGVLQNSEEFSRAFKCRPGSSMNPNKRCIIF